MYRADGGTGLFGTLTSLGTLCVNGHSVALPPETPVTMAGVPSTVSALRVGQVAWVVARKRSQGLVAERIDVWIAARGGVTAVDARGRRVKMAEGWITVLDDAVLQDAMGGPLAWPLITPGTLLAVSALPAPDGRLLATRVEQVSSVRSQGVAAPASATRDMVR